MLRLTNHFRKHKLFYFQVGITAAAMFLSPTVALASSLDDKGMSIYLYIPLWLDSGNRFSVMSR